MSHGGGTTFRGGNEVFRGGTVNSAPRIESRPFNGSREAFGRDFANREHHGDFDHHHGDFDRDRNWWWGGWGWGYPWWDYGYYGYAYPYYSSGDAYGDYTNAVPYTSAYPSVDPSAAAPMTTDYYSQGIAAFQQGGYRGALRLAGHASVDNPRDPSVHFLMSLAMFAQGDYRGAAMEAHAVANLGKIPDWNTLFQFYGNVDTYTTQLRALEEFVSENPSSPEGRFLLGFQYLIEGHRDAAQSQLLQAVNLAPQDRVAAELLTQAGGKVPENIIRQQQSQPATTPPKM
jgi:tetratricopeptide (TPR) repeat protein